MCAIGSCRSSVSLQQPVHCSLLWCAVVEASEASGQQTQQAGEEGQLCGQGGTGQSGASGEQEDEGQDQSHPGKPLSSL